MQLFESRELVVFSCVELFHICHFMLIVLILCRNPDEFNLFFMLI